MSHDRHVLDGINKDLVHYTQADYLRMTEKYDDIFGFPSITHEIIGNRQINIVRDDSIIGSKARFGQYLFQEIEEDTVVYVQPRKGLAGVSILELAKRFGKKVVLFMPASKEVSYHQAVCIERGAIPKFRRIAAMPVLNKLAKEWAEENGARFIPLGLYHPMVVAGAVRAAYDISQQGINPKEVWTVISTGVLSRGLQIGWPDASFKAIAVARNLKAGELGKAEVISHPLAFNTDEKAEYLPPFASVTNYDAKAWRYIAESASDQALFWNVGQDPKLEGEFPIIDSQRAWHEVRDEVTA